MMLRHPIASAFVALALGTTGAAMAQSISRSSPQRSTPLVLVEAVQLPASVVREGVITPLAPGMELRDQDQIRTGPQSRVLLRTADGSTVKLGEKGSFFLDNARVRGDSVFEAAMRMAEGAFRFTTGTLERLGGRREVKITFRTVTAGIRGTDVWGKSTPDNQIVCLIEGGIEVTSPGERPFTMDQPLSFYALEGDVSRAIATVPPGQLREWAAETETQPGQGVSKPGGKWKIAVASAGKPNDALQIYVELRKAGYPAEIVTSKTGDKHVYGVQLVSFETRQDAEFVADSLKRQAGFARYDYKVGT